MFPEVIARDRQAATYLRHAKFPPQVARAHDFLASVPTQAAAAPVLELGSGPGPMTMMLAARGFQVMSVDFSEASLLLNRDALPEQEGAAVTYVRADLNELRVANGSTSLLMMCDFLQHLGDERQRGAFLTKAFGWLRSGGRFYLTFFNLNLRHRLRNDIRGAFSDGAIKYERLRAADVLRMFPGDIIVDAVRPMNLFHRNLPDRVASKLPGASLAARMMAVSGRKR